MSNCKDENTVTFNQNVAEGYIIDPTGSSKVKVLTVIQPTTVSQKGSRHMSDETTT